MRKLHRWVSIITVLYMTIIAATGIGLQLEEMGKKKGGQEQHGQAGAPGNAAPVRAEQAGTPLPAAEIGSWMETVLKAAHNAAPNAAVLSVQMRMVGDQPQGVVTVAASAPKQLAFNARTGAAMEVAATASSSAEGERGRPQGPQSGHGPQQGQGPQAQQQGPGQQQQGMNLHQILIQLHKGALFGATGIWVTLICGVSLFLLCLSGVFLYIDLWRRRANIGRKAFFWA
jgi:hypothetical protein